MARTRTHVHSFNVGEVGVSALARVDQERMRLAAETQENIFARTIGKGQFRPGTGYIIGTKSNNRARLIPFVKSVSDTAILELTTGYLRVLVSDALVTRASVTSTVGNGAFGTASATITVTIATPGVVTWTAHGFSAGQQVSFKTTGALPTGITAGTIYYVQSTGLTANAFRISATNGGADIDTTGAQSGVHTGDASWVTTVTAGGLSTVGSSRLALSSPNRGGTALAKQAVTTSSANTEHALRIVISRGPVSFRCGSTDGGDDYVPETALDEGTHSLAFTPTSGTYYIQFFTRSRIEVRVTSCTIEAAGVMSIAAPWSTDDLRLIRIDRVQDVAFLSCSTWRQRKIERRNNPRSWSLVMYYALDGPFTSLRTADVKLTPAATKGNTTLASDRPFFTANHVGCLFKLFHEGQRIVESIAAAGEYTDAVRIGGVGSDRTWSVTSNSSAGWAGTIQQQRSFDSEETGFVGNSSSSTWTATINAAPTDTPGLDNVIAWYRYGFSVYTSGTIEITVVYGGGGGNGIARVVAYNSPTSVDIEIIEPFLGITATSKWYEGEWSEHRGWPDAVAFHDGRLGWARGDKFWLSASDAYYTFGRGDAESITDASTIARPIATAGSVDSVNWMLSLQRLIFGTQGAEAAARSDSLDNPITPTSTQIKDASTQGSAAISPVKVDKRGAFVQRSGNLIYLLGYNFEQQDYDSSNLMEMHEYLGGDGIVELAVQRQPDTYLWSVRADGQCPFLLYEPQQKIAGWGRFVTDGASGEVESIAVLPGTTEDIVYMSVKRTISGGTVRYIEKLNTHRSARGAALNKMADSGLLTTGPATSVTMAHLASQTGLVAWATNSDGDQVALTGLSANGSGVIDLGATYTNIWSGLIYTGYYKSAKLAYGTPGGTGLLAKKRVGPIGLLLADTHPDAITFGPDFTTMDQMPRIEAGIAVGSDVHTVYDQAVFPFEGEWSTDSRVCLKMQAPYPATLLGLVVTVEVSES